ncbi:CspA family cold shock protein [Lactobacillus colini]|uniref:CspA family cold shock protein n=1 Tax=Lactobacillus colini TaxID=1819254 RepID=A0ABS4MEK1_9LACO|nr:cold shock domain-containing protein [Lactobacillus colini]MBP2057797.1 CspA family cold shock protein [Lactobacillus colini]
MRTGVVKQFDANSAYGFIEDDLTHSAYFVFYKSIKEDGYKRLDVGQRVHYQLAQGKKGLQCINVYVDHSQKE